MFQTVHQIYQRFEKRRNISFLWTVIIITALIVWNKPKIVWIKRKSKRVGGTQFYVILFLWKKWDFLLCIQMIVMPIYSKHNWWSLFVGKLLAKISAHRKDISQPYLIWFPCQCSIHNHWIYLISLRYVHMRQRLLQFKATSSLVQLGFEEYLKTILRDCIFCEINSPNFWKNLLSGLLFSHPEWLAGNGKLNQDLKKNKVQKPMATGIFLSFFADGAFYFKNWAGTILKICLVLCSLY